MARSYKGTQYWEAKEPVTARTGRLMFSFFRQAGKLQVSQLWPDKETGELRKGKTLVLDQEDMVLHPDARALLVRVLDEWSV